MQLDVHVTYVQQLLYVHIAYNFSMLSSYIIFYCCFRPWFHCCINCFGYDSSSDHLLLLVVSLTRLSLQMYDLVYCVTS